MQDATGVLTPQVSDSNGIKVLDTSPIPVRYTSSVLEYNPEARVYVISLPVDRSGGGGDKHMVEKQARDPRVETVTIDIRMLKPELAGPLDVPRDHPLFAHFRQDRPFLNEKFDLIFGGDRMRS